MIIVLLGLIGAGKGTQAKMLVEVDIKKRDVKEVVNEWLDNNPDKWKSWLPK